MIRTRRLVLRPLEGADAAWIATEIARPEVHQWLTSPPCPYGVQEAQSFIAAFRSTPGVCVIEQDGVGLGVVSIETADRFVPDRPTLHELGYWLRVSAWGQGMMTEAAQALLAWHMRTQGGAVYSGYIRGNSGSARVLAKLGFLPFETVTRRSEFHDGPVTIDRVIAHPDGA